MEFKNLHSYKNFLNEKKKYENEIINEGLFGWLKKMFNKMKDYAKQIKESGEIDQKIEQAKTDIDGLFNDKLEDMIIDTNKKGQVQETDTPDKDQATQTPKDQATQTPTGDKVQDSYQYIAEAQVVKEKEKTYDNPIDEAIGEFIKSTKEQMQVYLTSKNQKVKLYAQAKISELNQHIIKKKIEIYKAKKAELGEDKLKELMSKEQTKLKEEQTIGQKLMNGMAKLFKKTETEYNVGDEITYKSKDYDKDNKTYTNKIKEVKDDIIVVQNDDNKTFDIPKDRIIKPQGQKTQGQKTQGQTQGQKTQGQKTQGQTQGQKTQGQKTQGQKTQG